MRRWKLILATILAVALAYFGYGFARGLRYSLFDEACGDGHSVLVAVLLRLGADPDGARDFRYADRYGFVIFEPSTPLHRAAFSGHTDVVRRLVAAQARLDIYEGEGLTPLDEAIIEHHTDVVQVLLDAGAPTIERGGYSAVQTARNYHYADIIQLFEQHRSK